jgi:Ankyrin repeats (many copies)
MLASYHGHLPLVQLLLQHGADPNTLNDRGQSPLAGAVFKNEEEIIKALLGGVSYDLFLCRLFPLFTPEGRGVKDYLLRKREG